MKNILYTIILSFLFSFSQSTLAAQCIETGMAYPNVVCSKYSNGDAVRGNTIATNYMCGKGKCVHTVIGWKCSKIEGGGAMLTNIGAKCQGGCERPKKSYCMTPTR